MKFEIPVGSEISATGDFYGEDGLLYCGKCRTPKTCEINIAGRTLRPRCLCRCEEERIQREQAQFNRQQEADRVERLRSTGFPEKQMRGWTFAGDDGTNEKVMRVARNYVAHFDEMRRDGKGLLLFGTVGTGKTYAAACIANALIDRGVPCLVTSFARLANKAFDADKKQEYLDSLNDFELLVIDDLDAERSTEYMSEIVHTVVNARYATRKPLIVTTNTTAEQLKNPADIKKERIYSRLFEMCLPVEVAGRDRRKQKLIDNYKELKQLLEHE